MLRELASEVGEAGRVLAIDLSPMFVGLMRRRFADLQQISVSQCSRRSLEVPAAARGAVDIALILDVYHHLEYPRSTMRSLKEALKRRAGKVVVVDFHRDPSKMRTHPGKWALEHIRADQATFRSEILGSGYTLIEEPALEALDENYVMVFGLAEAAEQGGATD